MSNPIQSEDIGSQIANILERLSHLEDQTDLFRKAFSEMTEWVIQTLANAVTDMMGRALADALRVIPYIGPLLAGFVEGAVKIIISPSKDFGGFF